MEEIVAYEKQLPDNIEDVARFAIFNSEKLKSLRAEINAIDKLHLAKEVYDQKLKEQQILGELVMDAFVKIGQFSKQLPKATGKNNQYTQKVKNNSTDNFHSPKTKAEVMYELGFSPQQTQRLEILANNPDVVEQVKQEARENDDLPTRTRVIDIVQQKKREADEINRRNSEASKMYRQFHGAIFGILTLYGADDDVKQKISAMADWIDDCKGISVQDYITDIGNVIMRLEIIRSNLLNHERS